MTLNEVVYQKPTTHTTCTSLKNTFHQISSHSLTKAI